MTTRNPVEFTDGSKRVGNKVVITDTSGLPIDNSNPQQVQIRGADTPSIDAFGRLRTSQPFTIFDSKQINDNQPLFWNDVQYSGAGTNSTYNTNKASVTLSVSANTAGHRIRQTYRRFNYQPGKSQLVFMTFTDMEAVSGVTKRIGYFDFNNGIFVQSKDDAHAVGIRSYTSGAAVDNLIQQSDWNLDTLDGNGQSGINLDFSKTQILVIDFEWLGVGRVRIGFNVGGLTYYCHEFKHSNILDTVYMSTPNLPLRYEIIASGTNDAASMQHICSSVQSEGGLEFNGFGLNIDRGITPLTTLNDTDVYPLIAIRLKAGYLGTTVNITNFNILNNSTADFRWSLVLNPTVTGTALSFTAIDNSAIEAQVNTTNATKVTAGTGTRLMSGYISSTAQSRQSVEFLLPSQLTLGSSIAGVSDVIVLCVQNLANGTENYFASLGYREII